MSDRIYGVDVSTPVTSDQWSCLVGRNCKFVVVRGYRNASGGVPDGNCPATVAGAWAAGMTFVDLYAFPLPCGSKSAAQQADELLTFLADNQVTWSRLWLDVESGGDWPAAATSLAFIQAYVDTITAAGHTVGIYCSTSGWNAITADSSAFAHLPLWWSSHGASFAPFGGWSAPALVQYAYETANCGLTYDSDYTDTPPAMPEAAPSSSSGGRTVRIRISGTIEITID